MKILFKILVILFLTFPAFAEQQFHYRTIDASTQKVLNTFSLSIGELDGKILKAGFTIAGKDATLGSGREEYVLDKNYDTRWFRSRQNDEGTDIVGERRGKSLFLKGTLKWEAFSKEIKIDERPFYFNPKIGLMHFVRSGKRSQEFWSLNKDDLAAYLMKAKDKGSEKIFLGSKEVEAVKVEWKPVGIGALFFKRTYWFRKSDGVYLKQVVSGDKVRELIVDK